METEFIIENIMKEAFKAKRVNEVFQSITDFAKKEAQELSKDDFVELYDDLHHYFKR